jgi:hypothetical protein
MKPVNELYTSLRGQSDRRAAVAGALGATDIFVPRWFAHNLPAIHVPLIVLAAGLHMRNLRLDPPLR